MSRERKDVLKATEWIAIFVVIHYCLFRFMETTSFSFSFGSLYSKLTFPSLVLVGSVRLAIGLWREFRKCGLTKGLIAKILLIGLSGICCLLLEILFSYTTFLFLIFAAFCLYGIDADKVLKVFTICVSAMFAAVILCCLAGAIPNILFKSVDTKERLIRGSYGIIYPTDFAAYFLFLILFFWCGGKRKPMLPVLGMIALAVWFIYNYANSNSSELCLLLTAAVVLWEALEHKFFFKRKKILKIAEWIAIGAFPLLGIAFCGLTWLYGQGNTFAIQANSFLHSRLSLTWKGIQTYGISAFGAATPQNGFGGGDIFQSSNGYDFLDSSYGLLLVRYGWVLALITAILWVWMTRKAFKNGYHSLAYAMVVIAVHSFSEHHFPEIQYNILLAMPLCCTVCHKETEQVEESVQEGKRISRWIPWLTAGGVAAVCFLLLPSGLAYMRTAFELKGWENSPWALLCCLACVVLIGLLAFFLSKLIISLIEKKKPCWIGLACAICALCAVFLWTGITVNGGKTEQRLSADAEPLKVILASAKEPVYADALEALYQQKYPGISRRVWTAEEMAGIQKGTILTDREPELNKLISTGAVYAEISGYSSIYTYDRDVAEALKSAGYKCHGFYYTERSLDNEKLAELNNLERAKDGALLLTKEKNSIVEELDLSLYGGNYRTAFDLSLDSQTKEGIICSVAVTTYKGETQVFRRDILADEFDENGHAQIFCDYKLSSSRDVRFEVYSHFPVNVNWISWRRNEPIDTRSVYDSEGRTLEVTYYTLDGQPTVQSTGNYGVRYNYEEGNINWIQMQYLDNDKNLMMANNGYAQSSRTFQNGKLLMEQRYFDTHGNPVNIGLGYTCARHEYTGEKRSLTWYEDTEGHILEAGSSYLHQYLQSLKGTGKTIFITVKDEGTDALTETLMEDLRALGVKTNLIGKFRNSYYAVISSEGVIEGISADEAVSHMGAIDGVEYTISSAGLDAGNYSSIILDGIEYSRNVRGLNIVVVENGAVIDSVSFDTCSQEMAVTR